MRHPNRRSAIVQTSVLLCSALAAGQARSQNYPAKTIKIVVAYPAGGPADAIARAVAQRLSETLGQAVIVENKPGASGTIGADAVAKAQPDGHTLLVSNQLLIQAPSLYSKVPYDPLRDLAPITDLISSPLWLAVNAEHSSVKTLDDFVKRAKSAPGDSTYASVGNGSIGHLYGVQLNKAAGLNLTHVPYKGAAPVVLALLAGEVSAAFVDYSTLKPYLAAGKLRALAVSDTKRSPLTPDIPTFTEQGFAGFESSSWIGLFATGKTSTEVVQKLGAEVAKILKQPDVATKFQDQGFALGGKSPAQFSTLVATDFDRWAGLIKQARIKLD